MEILPKAPTFRASEAMFTGDVYYDVIVPPQAAPSRMRVSTVRFTPGARTAWHSHAVGQTLHVTEGSGLIQATPPGEWHWHGATPDDFMSHLAMWEGVADGPETVWGEHVTDEEYLTAPTKGAPWTTTG